MTDSGVLSEREREVLRLAATGASNKMIAQHLSISTNTVKVHLRNVFSKIGANSRTEAAMYAVRHGLVESAPSTSRVPQASAQVPGMARTHWYQRRWARATIGVVLAGAGVLTTMVWQGAAPTAPAHPNASIEEGQRWKTKAPMPTARSGMAVASYEGEIYAIGGGTAHGIDGTVVRYDPATDTWTRARSKPTPVTDIQAAVVGGEIFVPGGRTASGQVVDVLEAYDPRQDSWTERAPMPGALSGYAMVAFEGKLYLFGGWDGQRYLNTTYSYDPAQNTWRGLTPMPTARAFAGAGVAGGRIHVVGGYDGKQALPVNEQYIPELNLRQADAWLRSEPLPAGCYRMGIAVLADSIYLVGGEAGPGMCLTPIRFLSQDNRWVQFTGPGEDLGAGLGLVALESQLYAMGGSIAQIPQTRNLQYQAIYTILLPLVG
jgi:DNA-binding CsgD family transcriptional regulator/N-acetylneuraminic acid mutarotase